MAEPRALTSILRVLLDERVDFVLVGASAMKDRLMLPVLEATLARLK